MKMPVKKKKQLVKAVCDKKGVTSMTLAVKMNVDVDRFHVSNMLRKAGVKDQKP